MGRLKSQSSSDYFVRNEIAIHNYTYVKERYKTVFDIIFKKDESFCIVVQYTRASFTNRD